MQAVPVDEPSTEASSLEDSEDEAATSFGIGNSLRSILRSLGCSVLPVIFADSTARICRRFVDSDVQFFSHQVITLLCTIFVSLFKQLNFLDEIATGRYLTEIMRVL